MSVIAVLLGRDDVRGDGAAVAPSSSEPGRRSRLGRLDVRIKIEWQDAAAAQDIFSKCITREVGQPRVLAGY
jgi:hypothetical protein